MEGKALFTDLDGTLLNDKSEISEGNRAAVEKLREAGHHIVLTTGRPLTSAIRQANVLGLTGKGCFLIAFNGGVLYDLEKHSVIDRIVMPLPLVFEIFDEANRRGIHIQTYSESKVLVEPRCANPVAEKYCKRLGMDYEIIPDVRTLTRDPEKILLIDTKSREILNQFIEDMAPRYRAELDFFYSSHELLEIVPKGVNKGTAIQKVAEYLGVRPENTVAAGDEANDIPMLKAAHYGVAMKNASPAVLAEISLVSENDNNHDGVAEIIEKYLL